MGGTSTDVNLVDGEPHRTTESVIDGLPIRVPMLDIHTVGAGDASHLGRRPVRVGPESAGANPGPTCGQGNQSTITDAHVVLGHIDSLAEAQCQSTPHARHLLSTVSPGPRKLTRTAAAEGILRVANARTAIRTISVERGHDPRDFALVAFGCRGLHALRNRRRAGRGKAVIAPQAPGSLRSPRSSWPTPFAVLYRRPRRRGS